MDRLQIQAREFSIFVDDSLAKLSISSGMRVADIGCGTGFVSFIMSSLVGKDGKVVGLDANPKALRYCNRMLYRRRIRNLEFIKGNAEKMQLSSFSFDAVYSRFLLQHLKEPRKCLQEMIRITKPKGLVMVEDCDLTRWLVEPEDKAVRQLWTWYESVVRQKGSDPKIGSKLYKMFVEERLEPKVEVYSKPILNRNGKTWDSIIAVLDKLNSAYFDKQIITGIRNFKQIKNAIFVFPLVFRVWAKVN
jgi:ubiquinone/menaquinone biosynthesis C-methylase UbiE